MKALFKTISIKLGLRDKIKFFQIKRKILRRVKSIGRCIDYSKSDLFAKKRDIYFIHIPKAAGMSVVDTLYGERRSHHATAMDYLKQDKEEFQKKPSFTISRNPYTRLYSAYSYLKSGGMNTIDKVWWDIYLSKYASFEEFIVKGGLEKAIKDKAEHFIPQHEFVFNNEDKLLCDFAGKIEHINEVEDFLYEKLGRNILLSKKNVVNDSDNKPEIHNIYNNDMLKVVNNLYEKDFKLFGYTML